MKRKLNSYVGVFLLTLVLTGCGSSSSTGSSADADAIYETTLTELGGGDPAFWDELYTTIDPGHDFIFMDYETARAYAKNQVCTLISTGAPYDEVALKVEQNVVVNKATAKALVSAATKAYCPN
jgi:hypothetical protein